MGRKQKKYHYIYKTTNVKNDKFYIGMHSTNNLNDGYVGSGKRLWNSINYHGKDNHVCEILEYCKNRKELIKREEEIVNNDLLNEDLCMNLRVGGQGGFFSVEAAKKGREVTDKILIEKYGNNYRSCIMTEYFNRRTPEKKAETVLKQTNAMLEYHKTNDNTFKGRKHSEKTKKVISEKTKISSLGSRNSQFGKCWITNEVENKKIFRSEKVPDGWKYGRKM